MENKYYTPEIGEFHLGFEYEHEEIFHFNTPPIRTGVWNKYICELDHFHRRVINEIALNEGYIRVKCLDQEDIEAVGWRYSFKHGIMELHEFTLRSYRLKIWIHAEKDPTIEIYNDLDNVIFTGTVKNKSRLTLVMEMIGIKLDVA